MTQSHRLTEGGIVDRSRPLRFTFDSAPYEGYAGDTVASALLANGIHLVGRSFKYHRPRGIHTAGVEEPSALLQIGEGARSEPNVRATIQPLYDGLIAATQNRWPSLRFDVGAINDAASRLIPAGFYYKTFMWPATPKAWMRYEHVIRSAAGMGRTASAPDPDHYEHQYAHCDVLVVGAGPAGLAAARAAAHAGARDRLRRERFAGRAAFSARTRASATRRLDRGSTRRRQRLPSGRVTLLPRTTAFGYYDGNLVGLCERVAESPAPTVERAARALWKVRAKAVVLATGAHERGIAFANNDLPGTCSPGPRDATSSAMRCVRERVRSCSRTTTARTARHGACARGVDVASIVDARPDADARRAAAQARGSGHAYRRGRSDRGAHGRRTCGRSTSSGFPLAQRSASNAISCACRAAGTRPSTSFRRRGGGCATTARLRPSSPTPRRCRSHRRARQTVASTLPRLSPTATRQGCAAAARAGAQDAHRSNATRVAMDGSQR
jgi:sarcosine oxidase subunit alpha